MVPRTALTLALGALLLTAGCLGAPSPGDGTATATQTPTPTATSASPTTSTTETTATTESPPETTFISTDCSPYISAEPASDERVESADRVVAFEDLSPERRRTFQRALNGTVTLESGFVDPWVGTVVTYEGKRYATSVAVC